MKQGIFLLIFFIPFSFKLQAQPARWFFTLSSGLELGGPGSSVKHYMNENGFNATSSGFFIFEPVAFPYITHGLPLLGMVGIRINNFGSVYSIFGESSHAEVHGYNSRFSNNIKYNVLQFTGGYQFSFSKTRFKIGAGPSLFVLKYARNDPSQANYNNLTVKHTTIEPGLTIRCRMPFGIEKKLFGIEFFFDLNLAHPAKLQDLPSYNSSLVSYNVNMINGIAGLSFAFRK